LAKLIVMEDDVEFALKLKDALVAADHEVDVRYSASDAIEEFGHTSYDLLITDIFVHQGDNIVPNGGISLVAWVRKNQKTANMPIIAMTGAHKNPGLSSILGTAKVIGANEALEKPFATEQLLAMIDRLVTREPEKVADFSN